MYGQCTIFFSESGQERKPVRGCAEQALAHYPRDGGSSVAALLVKHPIGRDVEFSRRQEVEIDHAELCTVRESALEPPDAMLFLSQIHEI